MRAHGYIYCLTCKVSGKKYVGQTTLTPKKRFRGHWDQSRRGSETPLHRSLRKYAKLTAEDVRRIKRNPDGLTQTEFARRLGVTWWAVHNVLIGRTWKDVSI